MADRLSTYNKKRDFTKTPEPPGKKGKQALDLPIFTIQKHDATRLHYDFRLEAAGVLKSWAVTKVPSLDPGVKRLAVRTEDHPRGYAEFEGVIPEGEYGAGPVIVWDYGVYVNHTQKEGRLVPVERAADHGHVLVQLVGMKLRGLFALTRFKEERGREQWLFVKVRDNESREGDPDWDESSVLTKRTLDDVVAGRRRGRRGTRGKQASARRKEPASQP